MAQQENLQVLLTAGLDMNQSLKNINDELRQLARMASGQSITLKVNIAGLAGSAAVLDSINSKLNQLSENAKKAKNDSSGIASYINKLYEGALGQVTDQIVKFPANLSSEREKQAKAAADSAKSRAAAQQPETEISPLLTNVSRTATAAAEGTEAFAAAEGGAALASNGLKLALTGLWDAFWPAALLTGVLWGINKITDAVHKHNEEVKEAKTISYDQVNSLKQQKSSLEDLSAEMTNLQQLEDSGSINTDQKQRLLEIQKQLVSQYGVSANAVNAEGEAYATSASAINDRIQSLKEQIAVQNELNRTKLLAQDSENNGNIEKDSRNVDDYARKIADLKQQVQTYNEDLQSIQIVPNKQNGYDIKNDSRYLSLEGFRTAIESSNTQIAIYEKKLADSKSALQQDLSLRINDLNTVSEQYISELTDRGDSISDAERAFIQEIAKSVASDGKGLVDQENEVKKAIDDLQNMKVDGSSFDELISKYNKLSDVFKLDPSDGNLQQISQVRTEIKSLLTEVAKASGINPDALNKFIDDAMNIVPAVDQAEARSNLLNNTVEHLNQFVSDSKDNSELLNRAQEELKSTNHLSTDTIEQLNGKYKDFISVTGLSTDKVLEFIAAKKEETSQFITDEIEKTNVQIEESNKRILTTQKERNELIDKLSPKVDDGSINESLAEKLVASKGRKLTEQNNDLSDQKDIVTLYKNALNEINFDPAAADLEKVAKAAENAESQVLSLSDAMKMLDSSSGIPTTGMDKFYESVSKGKSEITLINTAQEELKNNGHLSIEMMVQLSQTFDDFSGHVGDSKEELLKYLTVQEQDVTSTIDGQKKKTLALIEATKLRIATIELEMEKIDKLREAYAAAVDSGQMTDIQAEHLLGGRKKFANPALLDDEKDKLTDLEKQANLLGYLSSDFKDSAAGHSEGSSTLSKTPRKLEDITPSHINSINESADKQAKRNEELAQKASAAESSKDYQEEIKQENLLIQGQTLLLKDLNNANKQLYADRANLQAKNKNYNMASWVDTNGEATESFEKLLNSSKDPESLKQLFAQYQQYTKAIMANKEQIAQTTDDKTKSSMQLRQAYFSQSEKFISDEAEKMRQAGNSELEIAKMVMEARVRMADPKWTEDRNIPKLTADEQLEANKNARDATNDYIEKYIDEGNKKVSEYGDKISLSQSKLKQLKEGTAEYNEELEKQIDLTKQQIQSNQSLISFLQKQLENENLDAASKEKIKNTINELILANSNFSNSIKDINDSMEATRESAADKIIEDYKKAIQEKEDLDKDALDKQIEAENARHKRVKDNLQDEYDAFEKNINAQLKALDRSSAAEDYETELNKKLTDRQKTVDELNTLALDNSAGAKKKRQELQDQLDAQNEEIDQFKQDRERELRKEGLQDQLDDRKDYLDQAGKAEDDLNTSILDGLDDQKKAVEKYYSDLLNDDEKYYKLKQGLMSTDAAVVKSTLDSIGADYEAFFGDIRDGAAATDQSIQNLLYTVGLSLSALDKFRNGDFSDPGSSPADGGSPAAQDQPDSAGANGSNGGSGASESSGGSAGSRDTSNLPNPSDPAVQAAWKEYLTNKQKAEVIRQEMSKADKNTVYYKNLGSLFDSLHQNNQDLLKLYPFADGSYDSLRGLSGYDIFSVATGGLTPAWGSGGKFLLAHEKELVLNQMDTANLIEAVKINREFSFSNPNWERLVSGGTTQSTTNDNRVVIENITIQATDKESGSAILSKLEAAFKSKLVLRTI